MGLCAFLDFNNEDKDERLVIFGGQTLASITKEMATASIEKDGNKAGKEAEIK